MIRQAKQGENAASDKRGHGVVRGAGVETTAEARLPQSRTGENQGIWEGRMKGESWAVLVVLAISGWRHTGRCSSEHDM